jgi:hypothetical protein
MRRILIWNFRSIRVSILILEFVFFMAELFSSCHQDTKALRKNEIISLCLGDFVANCFGYFSGLSGLGIRSTYYEKSI